MQELQHFPWYCWAFVAYSAAILVYIIVQGTKFVIKEIKSH